MARVKRGVTAHAKHKKVLKAAKGFYGRRKNTIRIAKQAVEKSMQYAYRDRKNKKRTFRALWIQRLNAAVREHGLTYSPIYRRSRQGGDRGRSQGPVRNGHPRAGGFRRLCGARQGIPASAGAPDRTSGSGAAVISGRAASLPSPRPSAPTARSGRRLHFCGSEGLTVPAPRLTQAPDIWHGTDDRSYPTRTRPARPGRRRRRRSGPRSRARRRARQEGLRLRTPEDPRRR